MILGSKPLLSLVTISYNSIDDLMRTHSSIENLIDSEVEWIVIDGASQDGTAHFLESCRYTGLKFLSEPDCGIYDAMNKGMRLANGEFVLFLNAGDEFILKKWNEVRSILKRELYHTDILYFDAIYNFRNGIRKLRPAKDRENYIEHGMPANHQATFIARNLLALNPFNLKFKLCGDYANIATLVKSGARVKIFHIAVSIFHAGGSSTKQLVRLFIEPYMVQRAILQLGHCKIIYSFLRRIFSTIAFQMYYSFPAVMSEKDEA